MNRLIAVPVLIFSAAALQAAAHNEIVVLSQEGRSGLLINEKAGADKFVADVTNAGQTVLAQAFRKAIR